MTVPERGAAGIAAWLCAVAAVAACAAEAVANDPPASVAAVAASEMSFSLKILPFVVFSRNLVLKDDRVRGFRFDEFLIELLSV